MTSEPLAAPGSGPLEGQAAVPPDAAANRLKALIQVQWALTIACAYLVLFGREGGEPPPLAPLLVAGLLATNLILGRLRPDVAEVPRFTVVLAGVDAVLIAGSLLVAGQLSVELVLLCVGVLVLAVAGIRIGLIAALALLLTGGYLGIVALAGDGGPWRANILLRVPVLFAAAIAYAWLVDMGKRKRQREAEVVAVDPAEALLEETAVQWRAIERCRSALRKGRAKEADAALDEVAAQNHAIRIRAGALLR